MSRPKMAVDLVLQEDDWGCAIATMAMVLGCSYQDAKNHFEGIPEGKLLPELADEWLRQRGYFVERRGMYWGDWEKSPWPPEPFGVLHTCEVVVYAGAPYAHMVIMQEEGTVLDPLTTMPKRLTDYDTVYSVASIQPPQAASEPQKPA